MTEPVKYAVKELYSDIKLSPTQLGELRQSIDSNREISQPSNKRSRSYRTTALASIAVLAATLCLSVFLIWPGQNKTQNVIADVVKNHLSQHELHYPTNSLVSLSGKFNYLGFMLFDSAWVSSIVQGSLIGARPCLILNKPSAQLRYQLDNNDWATVFQTRYDAAVYGDIPDISKQEPIISTHAGVTVSLWQERGLLFAVAK